MTFPSNWTPKDVDVARLVIATYLLGQMMHQETVSNLGDNAKAIKVKAAFEYADLLLKG